MPRHYDKNTTSFIKFDLLSANQGIHRWGPQFQRRRNSWKVYSGQWEVQSSVRLRYLCNPKVKTGENLSVVGSPRWNNFIFHANFKIFTDTLKPPEGGVILYFLFKNIKNFYSFHFCLFKQKIEYIKRIHGVWSSIAEQNYNIKAEKEYGIEISTISGIHSCRINGEELLLSGDKDIPKGRVGIGVKYCNAEFNHLSVSPL